jgi:hypothetical protein
VSEADRLFLLDNEEAFLLEVVGSAIDGVIVDDHDVVGIFRRDVAGGESTQGAYRDGEMVAGGKDQESVTALGDSLIQGLANLHTLVDGVGRGGVLLRQSRGRGVGVAEEDREWRVED